MFKKIKKSLNWRLAQSINILIKIILIMKNYCVNINKYFKNMVFLFIVSSTVG